MVEEIMYDLYDKYNTSYEEMEKFIPLIDETVLTVQLQLLDFLSHKIKKDYEVNHPVVIDEGFHISLDIIKRMRTNLKK